jgi:hypothetical protein
MKKTIVLAALGLAAVSTTYGQGFVFMNSYGANQTAGFITTYFNGSNAGTAVPGTFSVELYYALGTVTDPVSANAASITAAPSGSFTALPSSITPYDTSGDGYFGSVPNGPEVTISAYPSAGNTPISFELVATGPGGYVGRSGAWTESSIATSAAGSFFGDNGLAPNFSVAAVPEPATLALAGLGGLASLVALRRKQA